MKHVPARVVAAMLGIKTATLARWRREGRGPRGWFHLSATLVVYPQAEVDWYIAEQKVLASNTSFSS